MSRSSRRYRSPPGTLVHGTMSGSSYRSPPPLRACPPPHSSGNSRRSFHSHPPTRSYGNPNPQDPLPAVPARMSRSGRRSSPGRPPTRRSSPGRPPTRRSSPCRPPTRRSSPGRPPTRSSWNPNHQVSPSIVHATMSRSCRSPSPPRNRVHATMSESSCTSPTRGPCPSPLSFPGHPPTGSSRNPNPQDPLPTVPAAMSGSGHRPFPGSPGCVLLDSYGYVFLAGDDRDASGYGLVAGEDNHTTAQTFTEATGTINVTFVIADIPCLSYFYIRCIDLSASPFDSEPKIIWSTENLALLSLDISTSRSPEYFIYRAGNGRRPSLDPLPHISTHIARWNINPYLVGVLPDGTGTDFVFAAFRRESGQYKLDIFRSKQRAWTTELLVPDLPSWLTQKGKIVFPSKVIALQGGLLGFVDLWKGILLCNVLEEPVCVHFVPLPKLLPSNQKHYKESVARPIRDVTCTDGFIIRFVELEDVYSIKTSIPDASTTDQLFDCEAVDPIEGVVEEFDGWRLVTWSREISWDYWRKGSVSHADELRTVSLPHPDYGGDGAAESPLRTLKTSCPTVCGDDIVCLTSKNNPRDDDGWILTVDMKGKTVGEPVPYNAKRARHSSATYIPCVLNQYLNYASDRAQVGLQKARFDGHFSLQLPLQNSSKCNNTQQKRQRLMPPYNSHGLVHI